MKIKPKPYAAYPKTLGKMPEVLFWALLKKFKSIIFFSGLRISWYSKPKALYWVIELMKSGIAPTLPSLLEPARQTLKLIRFGYLSVGQFDI